mmetsp:Transcript_43042/g.84868  ORF Transcript_43042/g.84868 Transcript_43042/m.84868 type:complete len:108 (+) Transcript_43042:68-391(+)
MRESKEFNENNKVHTVKWRPRSPFLFVLQSRATPEFVLVADGGREETIKRKNEPAQVAEASLDARKQIEGRLCRASISLAMEKSEEKDCVRAQNVHETGLGELVHGW